MDRQMDGQTDRQTDNRQMDRQTLCMAKPVKTKNNIWASTAEVIALARFLQSPLTFGVLMSIININRHTQHTYQV
jgi:hypothetical protein